MKTYQNITCPAKALNEIASKTLLKEYGVPVVAETMVTTDDQAITAAQTYGFPVVIKGVGAALTHKTECGVVVLNVMDSAGVTRAVDHIRKNAGQDLEGILVQPQVNGQRQFVAGLFHDAGFGPVIMFGMGGVYTEALNDVSFRLAPVDEVDIQDMLSEISSRRLLDDFRGEKRVDPAQLKQVLVGLSELSRNHPEIREVDINPLVATADGNLVAVDALVIEGDVPTPTAALPVDPYDLGALFYPRSVAFVGASAEFGKWGFRLSSNTIAGGYDGKIYLVNRKGKPICGRPTFTSVSEIDGKIDLAVVTIPADQVLDLIPELESKRTKGMLLITAGFRETGQNGRQLEEDLVKAARKAGILILGPNTMGICNPHNQFYCYSTHGHSLPGSTALVSQSGNMGAQLLYFADEQGIGIRAFSGSGNEAMVTIEDYMEAFEVDDLTRTVVMYIESVKDGRRFFESARRVSKTKPIVVLKGGRTDAGYAAAASHTGAMASDVKVFDAACRQAGIIQVKNTVDLLDLSAVLSSLPLPKDNRVAIVTLGGGWGVVTADQCAQYGLSLPALPQDLMDRFDRLLPPFWSRANPIDIVGVNDFVIAHKVIEALLKWNDCDAVIHLGIHGRLIAVEKMSASLAKLGNAGYSETDLKEIVETLKIQEQRYIEYLAGLTGRYEKPVIGVSLMTDHRSQTLYRVQDCKYKGVLFSSPERAVKSLAGMYRYRRWRDRSTSTT